jgi:predicted PurR-regulated permease PerM
MDRLGSFLAEKTPRRIIAISLFAGVLVLFRHLLILLVFFVVFERLLSWLGGHLERRTRLGHKASHALVALLVLAVLGGLLALGVGRAIRAGASARDTLPARIAAIKQMPIYQTIREHVQDAADQVIERAQHYAGGALKFLDAFGHTLLYALIGLILAVVFVLERDELLHFYHSVPPRSLAGTLLRWVTYVAEAMLVTVQFQLVVAACNAALTFPVLIFCGIPHAPSLALMIFASGMVPVVGNFVSGAILTLLAYQAKGWFGVALFTALTFVLHKLESYYLNPRLAARHVRLPGFVLIVSLLLWEHLLGFVGLFLSFPFLYVSKRILADLRSESAGLSDGESGALSGAPAPATSAGNS